MRPERLRRADGDHQGPGRDDDQSGGYLVVGASDSGQVRGLPAGQERLFDEATLVPKVTRYLAPGFQLRVAVHQVPDIAGREVPVALVWAAPHPDGCCLFIANG